MLAEILLFLAGSIPSSGSPGLLVPRQGTESVRARVEQAITSWEEAPNRGPGALTKRLVACGGEAESYLTQLLKNRDRRAIPVEPIAIAIARLGNTRKTVQSLSDLLSSARIEEKIIAAEALGELGRIDGLSHLFVALDDASDPVRAAASRGILGIQKENPKSNLIPDFRRALKRLEHKDHMALLLGRLGSSGARELLRGLAATWDDEDSVLAGLSGLWIAGQAEDGRAVHSALHYARSMAVKRKACLVLGKLGDRQATRDLIDRLYEEQGVAADAHWALLQITGLHLRADPELWELWWERVGQETFGDSVVTQSDS